MGKLGLGVGLKLYEAVWGGVVKVQSIGCQSAHAQKPTLEGSYTLKNKGGENE